MISYDRYKHINTLLAINKIKLYIGYIKKTNVVGGFVLNHATQLDMLFSYVFFIYRIFN